MYTKRKDSIQNEPNAGEKSSKTIWSTQREKNDDHNEEWIKKTFSASLFMINVQNDLFYVIMFIQFVYRFLSLSLPSRPYNKQF